MRGNNMEEEEIIELTDEVTEPLEQEKTSGSINDLEFFEEEDMSPGRNIDDDFANSLGMELEPDMDIEKIVEDVIERKLSEKIEKMIAEIIEKAVAREIENIKGKLLD
jgi:hypothetical protein